MFAELLLAQIVESNQWVEILLLFMIAGMLGGILAALQYTDVSALIEHPPSVLGWQRIASVMLALLVSGLGGVGGALAALFLLLMDNKIAAGPLNDQSRLTYVATGVVTGFLGFRLMKYVAMRFEDVTRRAAEEQAERTATSVVEERLRFDQQKLTRMEAINLGRMSQISEYAQNAPAAIERLLPIYQNNVADREVAILLAWLQANRTKNLPQAIATLSESIQALSRQNDEPNQADLLYNRACYHARRSDLEGEAEAALHDLAASCRIKPENWRFAIEIDSKNEFRHLSDRPEFLAIGRLSSALPQTSKTNA